MMDTRSIREAGAGQRSLLRMVVAVLLLVGFSACAEDDRMDEGLEYGTVEGEETAAAEAAPNTLTDAERAEGWALLFDGDSFEGWRGLGRDTIPEAHWRVEDGMIRKVASGDVPVAPDGQPMEGGDIMTDRPYENFELAFEWRISPGGNSGVKYNVSEELSTSNDPPYAALGFEYQVLDDSLHADAEDPTHRTGALYDLIEPNERKQTRPVGEWNQSRIVFQGTHGEHWLNGEKIVEYDLDSPRFDSLLAASKYADIEGFADKRAGHIVFQDHGDDVWYRNVRIRELPAQ